MKNILVVFSLTVSFNYAFGFEFVGAVKWDCLLGGNSKCIYHSSNYLLKQDAGFLWTYVFDLKKLSANRSKYFVCTEKALFVPLWHFRGWKMLMYSTLLKLHMLETFSYTRCISVYLYPRHVLWWYWQLLPTVFFDIWICTNIVFFRLF